MKILFLAHAPSIGGAENIARDLAASLDRTNFEPQFLISDNAALRAQLIARAIPAHTLYLDAARAFTPRGARALARAVRAIARIVRGEKIDVLHSVNARMHLIGSLAAMMTRVPLVWTLTDTAFSQRLARGFNFAPRRVIAVSNFVAEYYRGAGTVKVIYPGVAREIFSNADAVRAQLKIPRDAFMVVTVARLTHAQGQDVLLRAAAIVKKEIRNAHFVFIGAPADMGFTATLREWKERDGINARLIGERDDVTQILAAADALAHCARVPEGFVLPIVQAMMQAKPVIATALGSAREFVREEVNGLLIPPDDPDALARALNRLLANRDEAKKMGERGRARVAEEFDLERQAARYQEIYADVVRKTCSVAKILNS